MHYHIQVQHTFHLSPIKCFRICLPNSNMHAYILSYPHHIPRSRDRLKAIICIAKTEHAQNASNRYNSSHLFPSGSIMSSRASPHTQNMQHKREQGKYAQPKCKCRPNFLSSKRIDLVVYNHLPYGVPLNPWKESRAQKVPQNAASALRIPYNRG